VESQGTIDVWVSQSRVDLSKPSETMVGAIKIVATLDFVPFGSHARLYLHIL
jgi:hypothetical protein